MRTADRATSDSLVSPDRLRRFFAPRTIAVVGASETSGWARFVFASAAAVGFDGSLIPVHPTHRTVFGRSTARSLCEVSEPVDIAFVLAPTSAVEEVLDDAAAARVPGAIVLASGYREVGDVGQALERRMVERARRHGITLLGPNCLGFLNAHDRAAPFALTVPLPVTPGPVGIALQSGALATAMLSFARSHAIGVSTLATMGNEAMIATTDVIEYLIDDDRTRVICLFLEEIRDAVAFGAAAVEADRAGKPIVALKVGSSPAGQQAALAHTGSVAGDDVVVDAALRQLNVVRVTSIEELLTTGALLGYSRWPKGRRMGVLTASGGACDLIADRASAEGLEIPEFAPETAAAIAQHIPPFAQARNPLDATGFYLANQRTSALTPVDMALDAALTDPGLDFVLFSGVALPETRPADDALAGMIDERMAWLGKRIASAPIPVIPISGTGVDVSGFGRDLFGKNGIHVLGGMDLGVRALGNALRWIEGRGVSWGQSRSRSEVPAGRVRGATDLGEPWAESQARDLLADFGIPTVPAELATSARAAEVAARKLGLPVAMKICSAQIPHKSEIGAVALDLRTIAAVKAGYRQVRAAGTKVPTARVDGVLVAPMRSGGVELLAGVTVDPTFGPVLTVGLGGIWVEVLNDVSLRVLPVDVPEVRRMLHELRGFPLLLGARGRTPADLGTLACVITRLSEAALSLGESLRSVEINPLWVDGDTIEALDVLVVTSRPRLEKGSTK